jgi:SOS response regulatory protein OraA/RecX
VPTVTAVRERRRDVAVELDGAPWRTLPLDVVARAGVVVGVELDRPRLRTIRRELRRAEALQAATRALRTRDLSRRALAERLARRAAPAARDEALATLERAGLVDDGRVAETRASALAARGYGDAAIRHDLAVRGLEPAEIERAVATLKPETARAAAVITRRGTGPKTARHLAARGFGEDAIEAAVGVDFANDP